MLGSVKNNLKRMNQIRKDHLYHAKSNKSAYRTLGYLEKEKGPLASNIKEECKSYASDVLKDVRYAPWLFAYSAAAGEFREGWLPSNYWGKVIVPKIQGPQGKVSELKSMNRTIFHSEYFPDLLSYANQIFVCKNGKVINPRKVKDFLFSAVSRVIFKPDNARKGLGIRVYSPETFDEFWANESQSGVFQEFIDQDEELSSFFSSAVSTLRLNTAINLDGNPELRSAHLRFGTGGDTHVSDSTQIRMPVCMETGAFAEFGYTPKWGTISHHPDSNKKFDGVNYPNFMEAKKVVNELHANIPYIRCVGWDVCVDKCGKVKVMEWNGRQNGISFPEATQGPCFTGLGW
jgi:hypothetical protein